jgi:hypothetical protein
VEEGAHEAIPTIRAMNAFSDESGPRCGPGHDRGEAMSEAQRPRWEYNVVYVRGSLANQLLVNRLDEAGKEGWKLVSVVHQPESVLIDRGPPGDRPGYVCVFKRPLLDVETD